VVTFVCDTGNKYLSKAFNKSWLKDNGLVSMPRHNNLLDLISKRADKGEMISVNSENTLLTAYNRMRGADVSQLPVMDDGNLVGILDEEDLLMNVYQNESLFSESVESVMVSNLETLDLQSDEKQLYDVLANGKVAIMYDNESFMGFITKVDLINRYKSAFALN
jgi:cystathionine beta-synthase